MVDEVSFFIANTDQSQLTKLQKLQLKRLLSHIDKKATFREDDLSSSVKNGDAIGYDDIESYESDMYDLDRISRVGLDLSDVEGLTLSDSGEDSTPSETFPSFVDAPTLQRHVVNFRSYKKLVLGSARQTTTKVIRFTESNRSRPFGALRSSMGANKTLSNVEEVGMGSHGSLER